MQTLTLEQAADFLSCVSIEKTIDIGSTITHICNAGTAEQSSQFVFVNDNSGTSVVSPDFFN